MAKSLRDQRYEQRMAERRAKRLQQAGRATISAAPSAAQPIRPVVPETTQPSSVPFAQGDVRGGASPGGDRSRNQLHQHAPANEQARQTATFEPSEQRQQGQVVPVIVGCSLGVSGGVSVLEKMLWERGMMF